ncbi:MAG TPA: zinc transporter ZupT [Bacteroidales bacterium]|nr:zinc transporter ZupT [Bacteroidales bacterium]
MENSHILFAFGLTLFAGLATGVGGMIAFFAKRTNTSFLAYSLGFSAGVMIYISLTEILTEANIALTTSYGSDKAAWFTFLSFIGGIALTALIDKIIPTNENPHEMKRIEQMNPDDNHSEKNFEKYSERHSERHRRGEKGHHHHGGHYYHQDHKLMRIGIFTAIALGIHNFPEGIATFMAGMADVTIGVSIALAIAIHNIPEGIAVSVPVYFATGSKKKALLWSVLSGFAEPLGAIIGLLILSLFKTDVVFGFVFAMVAGIMIYISFDELLPAAHKYGKHHTAIYGLISGIIVIGLSLILLK